MSMTMNPTACTNYRSFLCQPMSNYNITECTTEVNERIQYKTTQSSFLFPISGRAKIKLNQKTFTIQPGMFLHFCKGINLSLESCDQEDFQYITFSYTANTSNHNCNGCVSNVFALRLKEPDRTFELLSMITNELTTANRFHSLKLQLYMKQLMESLFLYRESSKDEKLSYTLNYIDTNYDSPIDLKELAELCNMTPTQFSYFFHKQMNIRPIDYVIQVRLSHATDLLKNGTLVNEAAQAVGYEDSLYFSRLYKKHYGITPSEVKNTL